MGSGSLSHSLGKRIESISPPNLHFPACSPSPLQFLEAGGQDEGPCCFPALEMDLEREMGKPPSLSPRRGLRGGCDFSLAQTKAEPWHLSPDSCVSQLLNSQTQGRCQFGEGGEHGCVHSHPEYPLSQPPPTPHMQCLLLPLPPQQAHAVPPRPSTLGKDSHPMWAHCPSPMYLSCRACCKRNRAFAQPRSSSEEGVSGGRRDLVPVGMSLP